MCEPNIACKRFRASIGARESVESITSFAILGGVRSKEEIEVSPEDSSCVEATVCRISPIWQVTAVQGRLPMRTPAMQSLMGTPQTPLAILIPLHGTTPMRRRMVRRTQAGVLLGSAANGVGPGLKYDFDGVPGNARSSYIDGVRTGVADAEDEPSNADRVISRALGIMEEKKGDMGLERRVAHMDPHMVRKVRRRVANTGEKSAPASTFQITEPGTDQACFQTAVMDMTAITCHISHRPLCE